MMKSNAQLIVNTSFVSTYIAPFFSDGNGIIIGLSICGSLIYVMNTKELSIIGRMIYVFIAAFIGYALATTVADTEVVRGAVAFVSSAVTIAITIKVLEFIRSENFVKELIQFILKILGRDK